jgi:3-oxoacyl-[acyl-carrier protein] reductase
MFSEIRSKEGRLDVLINNAGIASMNHSLLMPIETANKIMQTNFTGTFLFCREAPRLMQLHRYGRIVNFTSVAVPLQFEGEAVYAAPKAAVITLTQILAREFASLGITVNAIGPAPVQTDLIVVCHVRSWTLWSSAKRLGAMASYAMLFSHQLFCATGK